MFSLAVEQQEVSVDVQAQERTVRELGVVADRLRQDIAQAQSLKLDLERLEQDKAQLLEECSKIGHHLELLKTEEKERVSIVGGYSAQMVDLKEDLDELEQTEQVRQQSQDDLSIQIQQSRGVLKELDNAEVQSRELLKQLQSQIQDARSSFEHEQQAVSGRRTSLEAQIRDLQSCKVGLEGSIKSLEAEESVARERLGTLSVRINESAVELKRVKEECAATSKATEAECAKMHDQLRNQRLEIEKREGDLSLRVFFLEEKKNQLIQTKNELEKYYNRPISHIKIE